MENIGPYTSRIGVEEHGIRNAKAAYWHLPAARLYEHAVRRGEGMIAGEGPLVVTTGQHTGRSPTDRFMVREPGSEDQIWWGKVNRPIDQDNFNSLLRRVRAYFQSRDLYVFDGYAGADPRYRLPVRIITQYAWHSLFARNMFVRECDPETLRQFEPEFTVLSAPGFHGNPPNDQISSATFILIDLAQRIVLIGGTEYAGEIKKSIFTVMNYLLPGRDVLPMHCSANYGAGRDDAALFFGLSGTGKTTLSADSTRTLIGDDEHGWSADGIFNLEGGCYAKAIRLSAEGEPEIYATTRRFGTILENVVIEPETRLIDLDDDSLTENTRASYPISHLENVDLEGTAGHPRHVVFLTADAFGVLPPISRLSEAQALYHFLSGYTAKVAGTERGVTEPKATFSTCFGAPFMPRHPKVYAEMLGEKIRHHEASVWLINTGWTGGPYGTGSRIRLEYTRRMVRAALAGELDGVETRPDPFFGVGVPETVEGIPQDLLQPRSTWEDQAAYDAKARELAEMFRENFRQFESDVDPVVVEAGPAEVAG